MQATITGIDQLSKRILLDLDSGTKVTAIPEHYPVSLDQAKRLSRYLNILKKARTHLDSALYEKVELLGLKVLPLGKMVRSGDWEGLTDILAVVTDETTRNELELMIKGLGEKRERVHEFKASIGDEIELLQDKERQLSAELSKSGVDGVKVIKSQIKEIQERIKFLRQTTPRQYMERFDSTFTLSIEELKQHKELQGLAMKWLYNQGYIVTSELNLPNNRRVDVFGHNESGRIIIVEVKVSSADLLQDKKWRDYLNYCDEFYFLVPADLSTVLSDIDKDCGQLIETLKGVQVKREDSLPHKLDEERNSLIFSVGRALSKRVVY